MSVNNNLQTPNLENIPFMGSGKILKKKEFDIGSKVIVKDISGLEYSVSILELSSNLYTGITDTGMNLQFSKENVFLIL